MFDYKQRPPSKDYGNGYDGIKWDKEDAFIYPAISMSRDEFKELYPTIKKAEDTFNNAPASNKNRIFYTKEGRFETDNNGDLILLTLIKSC